MVLKFFHKKMMPVSTPTLADETQMRLDMLKSDYALGKLTEQEYRELCRTVNDAALKEAERRLKEMEVM